ncbi:MAG: hypothetical protein AB7N69_04335 [Immundisolibacter sp.]|uniref:hypothetical protein n=1 Tax=Immundisolibacter sp. TaxID=1934948 RepID=UPI003D0A1EB2
MEYALTAFEWLRDLGGDFWCLLSSEPATSAAVIGAAVPILALWHAARSFRKSVNNINYTELDGMYLELLKMALDRPYLRQPESIYRNPQLATNQQREYDTYARMIWNFLETIADRCLVDRSLQDTWYPVIQDEGLIHREWIRKEPRGFSRDFFKRFGPDGPFGDDFLTRKI